MFHLQSGSIFQPAMLDDPRVYLAPLLLPPSNHTTPRISMESASSSARPSSLATRLCVNSNASAAVQAFQKPSQAKMTKRSCALATVLRLEGRKFRINGDFYFIYLIDGKYWGYIPLNSLILLMEEFLEVENRSFGD